MNTKLTYYGKLCSLYYDATKTYAPELEVNFYSRFIEQKPGRVLEAMCGSGRLLIPLIERGFVVDGVDNSAIMLERCRQRFTQKKLTGDLYEQSLTELNLNHKYKTITIAVGSFQLIIDRKAALSSLLSLREHMYIGGNLLIDIFVPDIGQVERSIRIARIDNNSIIRLTTRNIFNIEEKVADAFCSYELIVDNEVRLQEDELIQVAWYTDQDWSILLQDAGFEIVKIYDEIFRNSKPSRVIHAYRVN